MPWNPEKEKYMLANENTMQRAKVLYTLKTTKQLQKTFAVQYLIIEWYKIDFLERRLSENEGSHKLQTCCQKAFCYNPWKGIEITRSTNSFTLYYKQTREGQKKIWMWIIIHDIAEVVFFGKENKKQKQVSLCLVTRSEVSPRIFQVSV